METTTRLPQPRPTSPEVEARLAQVRKGWGRLPNMVAGMAVSPALLEGYLGLEHAVSEGRLSARLREQLALGAARHYGCEYCAAAHTFLGRRLAGLDDRELAAAATLSSDDPAEAALLELAHAMLRHHGAVSDAELQAAFDAGWDAEDVAETVAHLSLATMTATFNRLAGTTVDWPV